MLRTSSAQFLRSAPACRMAAKASEEVKVVLLDDSQPVAKPSLGPGETSRRQIVFAVAGYATCSSIMLIVNKVAVHLLPAPSVRPGWATTIHASFEPGR